MNSLKFSVIIPAYKNAEFLAEAIQSVLDQSYPHFEIVVVNDASPDNTPEVVSQFSDSRIKYIVHNENLGLSAARNSGIRGSDGDWIALLDGDDLFHTDKLKLHAEFITSNPDVGATYNPRYELNHSAKTIRDIWRPPLKVSLSDLVQGYPFGPSDMVVKREWMFRVGLFNVNHTYVGEDLDINCRLALAGCTFLSVDKALNYRRYYSGRVLKNLRSCIEDTISPLERTFGDPRCPADVLSICDIAYSQHYILWSIIAFLQGDVDLGQEIFLKAIKHNPTLLIGTPSRFCNIVVNWCIMDDGAEHEKLIGQVLDHLPPGQAQPSNEVNLAVARGFFTKGVRAIIWDRQEVGLQNLQISLQKGYHLNDQMLRSMTSQLQNYEHEFGEDAALKVLDSLSDSLSKVGWHSESRMVKGAYYFSQAFQSYHKCEYNKVPIAIGHAIAYNPRYLSNRGAASILIHSITRSIDKQQKFISH